MEKAREFVEKFYNDDDFAKKVIREGDLVKSNKDKKDNNAQAGTEQIVNAAKKVGYDITGQEYEDANRAYFQEIGTFKAIKKAFHLVKLMKAVSKEEKK